MSLAKSVLEVKRILTAQFVLINILKNYIKIKRNNVYLAINYVNNVLENLNWVVLSA